MPVGAVDVYETLRAQAIGGGRCRTGVTALRFHGMARGLALMVATPVPEPEQDTEAKTLSPMGFDPALIRLLANMVLRVQAEVQHVY